jgi:hypothetical protein
MIFKGILSSGMFLISLLFLYTFVNESSHARQVIPLSNYQNSQLTSPVSGTLNILAVMVEFQPDSNRFTSGNGTYSPGSIPYLEDPGTPVDALPHDRGYFEAHLQFAKNYFERMSGNLLEIEYEILPEVYRLSNKMEAYSPVGENPALDPLAELAKETWELVEMDGNLNIGLSTFENTAFVIFHAGVGRDIELTGTTLDRTPQDIPSVYLNRSAIAGLLNDPSFSGFPISNGDLLVNNTLILPRTLSRSGEDASGTPFVLPLSINGMITAQIGSHLGLPDLFNTNTGESGIGSFGLMDGAGIFAYNGLFPPELSAWEKIWLGWSDPFMVNSDHESQINLPAASLRQSNSTARISISNDEYFLIENRHRDPDETGVTLTIRRPDGTFTEQTFTNNDIAFTRQETGFDQLLEPGVITDVSNYDFALPGGLDIGDDRIGGTEDDRRLNGGILIWHIDESVIRQKLGTEGINNNPDRRAVNLQEADGAQDIGRPVSSGFFSNNVNGSPFDFWWSGNNATVVTQTGNISLYENRFGPDTTPDNKSNSGAPSFFELYDFSDNLPTATFSIRPVNPFSDLYEIIDSRSDLTVQTFTPESDNYWKRYPLSLIPIQNNGQISILIPGHNGIQFYNPAEADLSEQILTVPSLQQPLTGIGSGLFSVAPNPFQAGSTIDVTLFKQAGNTIIEELSFSSAPNTGFISTAESGQIDLDGTPFRYLLDSGTLIESDSGIIFRSEQAGAYQSLIRNGSLELTFPGGTTTHSLFNDDTFQRMHTGLIRLSSSDVSFFLLLDGRFSLFTSESGYEQEIILSDSEFIDWPAIVDFNGDGNPDFFFIDQKKNQLIAKNRNGGMLNNFPITPPAETRLIGTPLIADINGDDTQNLIVAGQNPFSLNLYAYNQFGELLEGFPLDVGGVSEQYNQPAHPVIAGDLLIAVSHTGDLKMWRFNNLQNVLWPGRLGKSASNKLTGSTEETTTSQPAFSLLNGDETYNWPNPAVDETILRFQTSEPSDISIKITTMSGRTIYERSLRSLGGLPEEIVIDTSSWASGAYFALVTARNNGKTERKLVNIAIAK